MVFRSVWVSYPHLPNSSGRRWGWTSWMAILFNPDLRTPCSYCLNPNKSFIAMEARYQVNWCDWLRWNRKRLESWEVGGRTIHQLVASQNSLSRCPYRQEWYHSHISKDLWEQYGSYKERRHIWSAGTASAWQVMRITDYNLLTRRTRIHECGS